MLLSLVFAISLIAYIGIPRLVNKLIYPIREVKKPTCPIPSASIIRDAYGNVINGNKMPANVLIRLNI
jgi:hypothetical protein